MNLLSDSDSRGGCVRPLKLLAVLGCAVASLTLVSCKTELPTKKIDYKSTSQLPTLEIPPDLTRPGTDDRFTVPDVNPKSSATFSAYNADRTGLKKATSSTVLPQVADVKVVRAGNERWLVVKGDPDKLWPVVKEFWLETGFVINIELPQAGIMETDWAENRASVPDGAIRGFLGKMLDNLYSTAERDKYRTRLERSIQPGMTEIYISHRGMEEVYSSSDKSQTMWQPRPPNPDLEAEMLQRLMVRLGVQEDRAKAQLVSAKSAPRAKLMQQDGTSVLTIDDQFDRAWRRVGLALDRVGFTVEDRDRSKGVYFVRYIDPGIDNQQADDKGWLSKLKFWGSSDDKSKQEQYRILVKGVTSGTEVDVLNKEGVREKSETATRILSLLYDQLK